jgi:hypothetical protein
MVKVEIKISRDELGQLVIAEAKRRIAEMCGDAATSGDAQYNFRREGKTAEVDDAEVAIFFHDDLEFPKDSAGR